MDGNTAGEIKNPDYNEHTEPCQVKPAGPSQVKAVKVQELADKGTPVNKGNHEDKTTDAKTLSLIHI
eukprot:10579798-Prorocentrum_lima.AAC.1